MFDSSNNEIERWSAVALGAALSAKSKWYEPPGIDENPGVVRPSSPTVGAYIDVSGVGHTNIQNESVTPRDNAGRAGKRVARRD
ncbi:MAG: hypothetical protein ABJZ69_14620 [Hyphomicrobiales bacterium]